MLRLSYARNFFALICLLSLSSYNANPSSAATPIENQPQFVSTGCRIYYNPTVKQFKVASVLSVKAPSTRTTCIVRVSTPNTQKQYRLVPLLFKGQVKQAPATVAISSSLIGDTLNRVIYQSPASGSSINFDLVKQILPTNYTSAGKTVFGINIVLATSGGALDLTDVRFAIQEK